MCKRTAYQCLVRSILEFGATIWDPFIDEDIAKLERVQRRATKFIAGDLRSREECCDSKMLKDAGLSPLTEHRLMLRLVNFYKVVERKIPPLSSQEFATPNGIKRRIKNFSGFQFRQNSVEKLSFNNSKYFKIQTTKTILFRNSFKKTLLDCNHLQNTSTHCTTVKRFKETFTFQSY